MKKAVYYRREIHAGQTVLNSFTYPTRFGDELTRKNLKNGTGTPAAMQEYNHLLAIRRLTAIINENYVTDDWFVTLHYEKHNKPEDIETARKQLCAFCRGIKKLYDRRGIDFKYVKTTAYGERGSLHHHIVIPQGVSMKEITLVWKEIVKSSTKARPPECRALYDTGDYSGLAAYFCMQGDKSGKKIKNMRKWTCSRNCKRPPEEPPKIVEEIKWNEPPTARRGYYIDTDSIKAGCNPVTGRPYLFYTEIRLKPNFSCYNDDGKRLYGAEAARYYRKQNRAYLRNHWFDLAPDGEIVFKDEILKESEKHEK